jgi:hypothetical protein
MRDFRGFLAWSRKAVCVADLPVVLVALLLLDDEAELQEFVDGAFHAGSAEMRLPFDGGVLGPGDASLVVRV